MQGCEGQRRLDLEPLGAQHQRLTGAASGGAGGVTGEGVEKSGLAYTRLAAHHHTASRTVLRVLEEFSQMGEFALAAD